MTLLFLRTVHRQFKVLAVTGLWLAHEYEYEQYRTLPQATSVTLLGVMELLSDVQVVEFDASSLVSCWPYNAHSWFRI